MSRRRDLLRPRGMPVQLRDEDDGRFCDEEFGPGAAQGIGAERRQAKPGRRLVFATE